MGGTPRSVAAGGSNRPVSVLHVITTLDVGGAERMLVKLCTGADPAVSRHIVVCVKPAGSLAADLVAAGIEVHSLGATSVMALPKAIWRLRELLRARHPDVVQTWLYHADLVGTLAVAAFGRRIPLAWNIRCTLVDFSKYSPTTRHAVSLLARLSSRPDVIVSNSRRAVVDHLKMGYRPRRIDIIPNGFDTDRFHPDPSCRTSVRTELGIPVDAPIAVHLARFDPMKNQLGFLDAFESCEQPSVHALMIGRGVSADNAALAAHPVVRSTPQRVHFLGERRDAERLLAAADVFVNCSSFGEGFPNNVGEAMAVGLACLVTDVGESATVVGDAGRVVPQGDAVALREGFRDLISMPSEERAALGARARRRVEDLYALSAVVDRYEGLYLSLRNACQSLAAP